MCKLIFKPFFNLILMSYLTCRVHIVDGLDWVFVVKVIQQISTVLSIYTTWAMIKGGAFAELIMESIRSMDFRCLSSNPWHSTCLLWWFGWRVYWFVLQYCTCWSIGEALAVTCREQGHFLYRILDDWLDTLLASKWLKYYSKQSLF